MANYTVELIITKRLVYKIRDAQTDQVAERIARARFDASAPIDLVEEESAITRVNVKEEKNED